MVRTQGIKRDIDELIEPSEGTILYYEQSGLTYRNP